MAHLFPLGKRQRVSRRDRRLPLLKLFMSSRLKPVHPGDVLREDFMKPLGSVRLQSGQGDWSCADSDQSDHAWPASGQRQDSIAAGKILSNQPGALGPATGSI
jgi:hypothetical protein